jgi:hypothetical protein
MSVQQGPVRSVPALRRGFPARPRLVLAVLGGLVLALIIAAPPLSVLARTWSASDAGPVAEVAALCVVGAVIAWHRPANPLGWILVLVQARLPLALLVAFFDRPPLPGDHDQGGQGHRPALRGMAV